ncbi:MAG: DUF4276 family protein [Verrucomicrobiae bacterium]|nr:DUF4276 family protein [Verrucomicrobiae bacterium]
MSSLRFTLVTDGPSDAALLHPLKWLLQSNGVDDPIESAWADLRAFPQPINGLERKIRAALELYPCDLVFVHRDAERESRLTRVDEIRSAIQRIASDFFARRPYVCVVPVRMTEAWLLFDEGAIRQAAGNPKGTTPLGLPPISKVEDLPDPKAVLNEALRLATDKPPRRLRKFRTGQAIQRLAELIQDYSPLRRAAAFQSLEHELKGALDNLRG